MPTNVVARGPAVDFADAEGCGGLRADINRVIPRQLAQRLGHLLKPAVIGKAAIVNRRVGQEDDFIIG